MAGRTVTLRGESVEIDGLRAFARALAAVDEKYPGALRDANVALAEQVIHSARSRAGRLGGVHARAARSLRPGKEKNQAAILGGGSRSPEFWGAEFGAKKYRQFPRWKGNQWTSRAPGYFLHPALREDAADQIDAYIAELDRLHREAFPDGV